MIRSFRHRGLKPLYEKDDPRKLNPEHVPKLKNILALLDAAAIPSDMDLPGWRVTFRFEDPDPADVDYEDYH